MHPRKEAPLTHGHVHVDTHPLIPDIIYIYIIMYLQRNSYVVTDMCEQCGATRCFGLSEIFGFTGASAHIVKRLETGFRPWTIGHQSGASFTASGAYALQMLLEVILGFTTP